MRETNKRTERQAELLDRYWHASASDDHAAPPRDLDPHLASLTRVLRSDTRDESPDEAFIAHLQAELEQRASTYARRGRLRRPGVLRPWTAAAALAAGLSVVGLTLLLTTGGDTSVASAQEILERAQAAAASPETAGIESLVATQTFTSFYISGDQAGLTSQQGTTSTWYEAPHLLRTEAAFREFSIDGALQSDSSGTSVFDGTNIWSYSSESDSVRILRQDLSRHTFSQSHYLLTPDEIDAFLVEAAYCRTIEKLGKDQVAGREADVIELGRASCGWVWPGSDGRRVLWIDAETGLLLKSEQYAVDGRLFWMGEVTEIEYNGAIDPSRFSFTLPEGAELHDDRENQPLGIGYGRRIQQPEPTTLDAVRTDATFPVRVPAFVPDGFELESVEHWWGNELARELRSHADWVLLRYADAEGNWLAISQGFGGYISGFASNPAPQAETGTVEVNGTPVQWLNGNPINQWEPGMLILSWQAARIGDSWEITPAGEKTYGSPLTIGLASNVLSLDEMVQVAESIQ